MDFAVKDSGQRRIFESGMQRDIDDDKVNWALVADGPMLRRWAEHLTKGARKYDARNWMKAEGEAELLRFRESAFRHFVQWYLGEVDEDHAAAVMFNINGAEYVKEKMYAKRREGINIAFREAGVSAIAHPADEADRIREVSRSLSEPHFPDRADGKRSDSERVSDGGIGCCCGRH